jgi:hypothetical protein
MPANHSLWLTEHAAMQRGGCPSRNAGLGRSEFPTLPLLASDGTRSGRFFYQTPRPAPWDGTSSIGCTARTKFTVKLANFAIAGSNRTARGDYRSAYSTVPGLGVAPWR